jgi:hypothetical protein
MSHTLPFVVEEDVGQPEVPMPVQRRRLRTGGGQGNFGEIASPAGTNGVATTDLDGGTEEATAVTLQCDGAIVIGGVAVRPTGFDHDDVLVARMMMRPAA